MGINKKLSPVVGVLIMVLMAGIVIAAAVSNVINVNGNNGITVSNPSVNSGDGLTLKQVEYKGYYTAMPSDGKLLPGQTYGFSIELTDKNAVYKSVAVQIEITKSKTSSDSISKNIETNELTINYWDTTKNAWIPVKLDADGKSATTTGMVDYWSSTHMTPGYDETLPLNIVANDLGTYQITAHVEDTASGSQGNDKGNNQGSDNGDVNNQ